MAYQKNSKSKVAAIFVFDFCATVSIGLRASAVVGIKKNISGHITHFYTQKYTQTPAVVGIKDDQV
jgi:hypothetical protein